MVTEYIGKQESFFFEKVSHIASNPSKKIDISSFTLSYIQNQYLLNSDIIRYFPHIGKEEILLFSLKEAIYKKDFSRLSKLIAKTKKLIFKSPLIDIFLFSSSILLLAYKGEFDEAEAGIEKYISQYKERYRQRLRLYIYSFILFFYPNIPMGTLEKIEIAGDDNDIGNEILKLSVLANIHKSLKQYDDFYFYLTKALKLCLKCKDIINYLKLYEELFYQDLIRGHSIDNTIMLRDLSGICVNNGIQAVFNYFELLNDYLSHFKYDSKRSSALLVSLKKCRLYPYVHKLNLLTASNGLDIKSLRKQYPPCDIFMDISWIIENRLKKFESIPLFIPEELRPVIIFNSILSVPEKFERGSSLSPSLLFIDDIKGAYGVYQLCRDILSLIDDMNKDNYDKILNSLKKIYGKLNRSKVQKSLLLDIIFSLFRMNLEHNKKLQKIINNSRLYDEKGQIMDISSYNDSKLSENNLKESIGNYEIQESDKEDIDIELEELKPLVGKSREMISIKKDIVRYSKFSYPVLIFGESGTGKELIARSLHLLSGRPGRFIPINCSAIPEHLFESELFGFKKGAFSGASFDKKGLIESANKGTLFLDEIGDLPYSMQAKLLRFLQEGEILMLGDKESRNLDVRIIAATNIDIESEIDSKNFRNDLYQRLNVFSIHIKPLRDRKEDIKYLLRHFFEKYRDEFGIKSIENEEELLSCFESYDWYGNIRELENELIRIFAQLDGDCYIKKEYISNKIKNDMKQDIKSKKPVSYPPREKPSEKDILDMWQKLDYNVSKTAKALSVTRQWIYRVIKKHRKNEP